MNKKTQKKSKNVEHKGVLTPIVVNELESSQYLWERLEELKSGKKDQDYINYSIVKNRLHYFKNSWS